MRLTKPKVAILVGICLIAFALGRLAVRAVMNALMGGTLCGGDFL